MSVHGHFWTIAPLVMSKLRPIAVGAEVDWSAPVPDEQREVTLSGHLAAVESDRLVIIVHGLGGSPDSQYVRRTANAVQAAGHAWLRLAVRGADRSGADIYHGGLTADIHAALASPALARFERIALLGYSMGGHLVLRYAAEQIDPRVRAVAGVCPPLDLGGAADAMDRSRFNLYRGALLNGLKDIYRHAHAKSPLPTALDRVEDIRRIREWDRLTVVPRFGFPDVATFYDSMSAGPALGRIEVPALVVANAADPMIPIDTLRPHLEAASDAVTTVVSDRGGHVGWPRSVRLGIGEGVGAEAQLVRWLTERLDD